MAFDAGTIEAKLDLDRTPFQRGIEQAKRDVRDLNNQHPSVRLDLDDTAAEAKLARFRDQLAQLNNRQVSDPRIDLDITQAETALRRLREELRQAGLQDAGAQVDVDTGAADSKLRAILALLRQVAGTTARARVDVDTGAARAAVDDLRLRLDELRTVTATPSVDLDGYAVARAQVESLQRQLDQLSRTRATPTIDVQSSGGGGNGGGGGGGGLSGLLGQIGAIGAGIIALMPAGAQAAAAVGGLAGAITAAGAGTALFAAAAKTNLGSVQDSIKQLSTLQDQYNRAVTDTQRQAVLEKEKALLASLDPEQRKLVSNVQELQHRWQELANSVRPQTFQIANTVLNALEGVLKTVQPLLQTTADAFVRLSDKFAAAVSGPGFRSFVDFLTRNAGPAIDAFGRILGNLGSTLSNLLQAFEPNIRPVEDGLVRMTDALRRWSAGLSTNSGFQKFMQYARDNGPLVARTLGDLGRALGSLVSAVSPLGPPLLAAADALLRLIRGVSDSGAARTAIDQLATALRGLAEFANTGTGHFTLIAVGIGLISQAVLAHPWIAGLTAAVTAFGWIYDHNHELAIALAAIAGGFWAVAAAASAAGVSAFGITGLLYGLAAGAVIFGIIEIARHWDGVKHAISGAWDTLKGWYHDLDNIGRNTSFGRQLTRVFDDIATGAKNLGRWLGPDLTTAINKGLGKLPQIGRDIARWLGPDLTKALQNVGHTLLSVGGDIIQGLWDGMKRKAGELFAGIGTFLRDTIVNPIRRAFGIASPSTVMMGIGHDIIQGLINGMRDAVAGIAGVVGGIAGRIRGAFAAAGSWLLGAGRSVMSGLRNGIVAGYSAVSGFVGSIRGRVQGALASAGSWLVGHGRNAMAGLRNGISSGYGAVANFVGSIRGRVQGALASAGSWLVGHGREAMSGLRNGISGGIGAVMGAVSSIRGRIQGAFAGAGSWLVGAGRNIVQGIASGISSGIGAVGSAISSVTAFISSHLPHSPAQRGPLSGQGSPDIAGQKISSMIADGLKAGLPRIAAVANQLAQVVAASQRLTQELVQQQARDRDGVINEDEVGWDAATMGNRRYTGARFPNGQIRPTTIRNNNVVYHLNGVGPDVAAAMRELERQRAFLLGA